MTTRAVAVYRDNLLQISETFVAAQVGAMERYRAVYAGVRRVTGALQLNAPAAVMSETERLPRLRELQFKLLQSVPRRWRREIETHRPALVHAHFGTSGVFAMPLARSLSLPLVVTFHGFDITMHDAASLPYRAYAARRRTLFREAKLFIAVSDFIRERLIAKSCPPEKIRRHYIGVDVARFPYAGRERRERVVLFVGRLVEKKACSDLIDAMPLLERVKLVVIGSGPLESHLRRRAAALRIDCTFLGAQPPAVIGEWMRRAMVFCVPSVTARSGDSEAFGIVFIEAQSSGLPVVSTRHGGIAEAVADGETGLLVDEHDSAALAAAIRRLLDDADLWDRMSRAGRARTERLFDLDRQTRALEAIYDEAAEG